MGKGDTRRPTHVDAETFDDNWNRIFGRVRSRKTVLPLEQTCDDDWPDHPDYPREEDE